MLFHVLFVNQLLNTGKFKLLSRMYNGSALHFINADWTAENFPYINWLVHTL